MPAPTKKTYRPETRLVHAGTLRSQFNETSEALFLTQGYIYASAEDCEQRFSGKIPGYVYSRYSNPTMDMFEQRMAALEGAEAARSTATGMAAVTTALMGLVRAGDHVVAAKALFGSCRWVIEEWLPRFGVPCTLVDGKDLKAWKNAAQKNTKAFFMETPTNPTLEVYDIQAVADIAHNAGAKLIVDNVFATPLYQSPFTLGADCVVYSATKHIDGQGRVLGGIILGSEKLIMDNYHQVLRQTGPSLSPFNAWVLLKGLETLPVRVQRQTENAGAVSTALFGHKNITRLIYPGRADHPQADIIAKQMRAGSTLCSFEIKGGKEGAFRFLNGLRLIGITNNLGDAKSLITHPTTTTHQRLTPAQRAELGIGDGLVRFSAGLEHPDDLIEDLLTALDKV
ncbi:MAG: O-succinylhomoserine sulfhydrylase [Pseudolabrys sp.]|nr:O-succinylhomoserine sulfhydrylase [Pseudolabrys sp.]MSP32791.1 O-succinylhomoserine sulfhydrylase [Pseudolabrys sp.]